ncbi:MAG: glucose-phosphate thymidylyltransferase [Gaiellaceae bacterium]|jgi:NDP-sugar pyrophosphorylase family protein|nr:glucose-phosphate thymidylyltransferase [Gaiellaceae bacterium]
MAAGLGTRLRPLTERWAKPVLPVDGEPVLVLLLRELAAAGCTDVTVVVGHLGDQVRRLCADGSEVGLRLRYAVQAEPDGSAGAVAAAAAEAPYLVLGADTVFTPGDVAAFAAAWSAGGTGGALALRPLEEGASRRNGVRAAGGVVEQLHSSEPTHVGAPLWAVGPELVPRVADLRGDPPHELAAAFAAAIDAGTRIAGIEIGPTRDLTTPADLLLENFPYLRDL